MGKKEHTPQSAGQTEGLGEIKLADEVVAAIAGLAATEVDGVASLAGNLTGDMVSKVGKKKLSKSVKVDVADGTANVLLALVLKHNCNIRTVSAKVQNRVKTALENMTGLTVTDVNVRIEGVQID